MKKLLSAALLAIAATPLAALAESWTNAPLVDQMCSQQVKDSPDSHTTACLIKCAKSGYGIFTPDGAYLKLDGKGNKQALEALKATRKKDHVRVDVTGEKSGDRIQVASLKLAQ